MRYLLPLFALALLVGCNENPPVPQPKEPFPVQSPKKEEETQTSSVLNDSKAIRTETVESVNLAAYGITEYPGAKMDQDVPAIKSIETKGTKLIVTMDSKAPIRSILNHYKGELKDLQVGLASADFGGLDGVSSTGNRVVVTVISTEKSNTIVLTIDLDEKQSSAISSKK